MRVQHIDYVNYSRYQEITPGLETLEGSDIMSAMRADKHHAIYARHL